MAKMSLCTCTVQLAGDVRNVHYRGPLRPVTWPEVEVLQLVHGDDAVNDIEVIDTVEDAAVDREFERLALRYGIAPVKELFPGKRPAMDLEAPKGIKRKKAERKAAPKPKADPAPETPEATPEAAD